MSPTALPDEGLFEGALQCRTPAERAAYLDRVCAGQPELRRKLDQLLEAHDRSGEFLESALAARPTIRVDLSAEEEAPGTVIGRYKLLQKIGEGGMGAVYMAEQTEPVIRKVAFKIIKLGMDTKQVVARFEAERQALALMDHPNIAKVLDAGATETGRPYFVMELVHGVPITEYCDKNKLSTQQRLELFIPVCQAIQHAHQKGIIHRDIKPSNVMVTLHDGQPVPRVIDFGIAKATNQRLTEKTLFTNYAQMIGTPAYMSPEQAEMSGLDIDTRSDIYSLGVLLYELLTGTTPFDAKELLSKGYAEMQRIIAELEPVKPSTRMSTMTDEQRTVVASQRSTEVSTLRKVLQGDLDWIVMKCLEKDRTRRYETSNGLAADVRRHLNNELIAARPPTTGYLLKKLIKRNKVAFAAGAAIAASLVIGIAISSWQAIVARQAEHRAQDAERRALATVGELRGTAPAIAEQARALVAQSKFDEAIAKLNYAIQLRPDTADYLLLKANLLQCQLKLAGAAEVYRAAVKVKPDDPRARTNLTLTEELIAAQSANLGKLTTEHLARLLAAMQAEQRSAAELLPVSERLGEEKVIVLAYWLERLKDLPIAADKPLKQRLGMGDSGKLVLDLSDTVISDLTPLSGMPLGWLSLAGCREVSDVAPLRGSPLRTLSLSGTAITKPALLRAITTLVALDLGNTKITDLEFLQGLKLQDLSLTGCNNITDIQPLAGMPLAELSLRGTRVTSLVPLRGMPLKRLDLTSVPAYDFESLSRSPLEILLLQDVRVSELFFLKGMPLKQLALWNVPGASGYAVLSEIKTLELLVLPATIWELPEDELLAIESLKRHPTLRQLATRPANQGNLQAATASTDSFWPTFNAHLAMYRGQFDKAEEIFLAELQQSREQRGPMHSMSETSLRQLINCQITANRYRKVAYSLRELVYLHVQRGAPRDNWREILDWQMLAGAMVLSGDTNGYRKACAEMLQRHEATADARVAEVALKICVLAPSSGVRPESLERLVKTALAVRTESWTFTQITCALMDYRAGHWDASVARLQGRDVFNPDALMSAHIDCILGMNYQRKGDAEGAAECLRRVSEYMAKTKLRLVTQPHLLENWLQLNALATEAAVLIQGSPPGRDSTSSARN